MRTFLPGFIFLTFTLPCLSQDIKVFDFTELFKKNRVREQRIMEVYYEGNTAVDTLQTGRAQFDGKGRIISYEEYFARGRTMARYCYAYDTTGKIISHTVATAFNDFNEIEMNVVFDSKGRIKERSPIETITNFWAKEIYHYSKDGVLVKIEQWNRVNDEMILGRTEEFPPSNKSNNISLSDIYDKKGLPILRKKYSSTRAMAFSVVYQYEFF